MCTNQKLGLRVVALAVTEDGQVVRKIMDIERQGQLENTLLEADYPNIRVATIDIPQEQLEDYQKGMVERTLGKRITYDGVEYSLVGASASAKNGKYYAVDAAHEKLVAKRFQFWPEAAMTYFGILVSPCKALLDISEARVLVVQDHELGTNDCRGWIRRSLFERLDLPTSRFYQFRMSFDQAQSQAKGSFKVMDDDIADALAVDVVIPKSSCKPGLKKSEISHRCAVPDGRVAGQYLTGRVVIGIREISRNLEFSSSYTLVEHAPPRSIETEIKPVAIAAVEKVRQSIQSNDFEELFRLLGVSTDVDIGRVGGEADPDHTSSENTVVEAVLKADGTGYWLRHPFINAHLQRMLAKWAYKLCTAGGFTLPAFALADDGFLLLKEGTVYSGSDWIPEGTAITSLDSDRMLIIRYPIRTKGDLLPVSRLSTEDVATNLTEYLRKRKCSIERAAAVDLVERQLQLEGTLTLHSATARLNGGDYDFDWVCVVEAKRFPAFVEDRFEYDPPNTNTKNKMSKRESPWWNLAQVAYSAKGNAIGAITDLKTSCLAAGRTDLADLCAVELQKALDQLKWGVEPDQEAIGKIRAQVGTAPWLKSKRITRVSELPLQVDTPATDRIGSLYNFMRKELHDFFSDVRPLEDFRGAIAGGNYDREMYIEAGQVSSLYAVNIAVLAEKRRAYEKAVAEAERAVDEFPMELARASQEGIKKRKELLKARGRAKAALHFFDERSRRDMRNLINIIRKWAERKEAYASDWLAALWDIACKSRRLDEQNRPLSMGSIPFYAFPQALVDRIVERTGGRPITVALPHLADGEVEIEEDGNVYLVDETSDGAGGSVPRKTLLLQVPGDGRLISEGSSASRVSASSIKSGQGYVRNGRLELLDTQLRPAVRRPVSQM